MSGINAYQENAVVTQSRGRLIVMLYDGAVKFLRQAIAEMEREDWVAKGVYINKAAAIVDELDNCLDMEGGGEIAENLRRLYGFLRRHLSEANVHRDPQRLREAIKILDELNEGWRAITT
jgi:flagellar protein FliS